MKLKRNEIFPVTVENGKMWNGNPAKKAMAFFIGIIRMDGAFSAYLKPLKDEAPAGSWVLPGGCFTGVGIPRAVSALKIKNGPEK